MEFLSSNQFSEVSTIEILGSRCPEKYKNKTSASKMLEGRNEKTFSAQNEQVAPTKSLAIILRKFF